MHRDAAAGAVGQIDARVLDSRDAARVEDAHPVNQRAALRRSFHQSQLTRHRGLPRSYSLLYSIPLTIRDGAHKIAPMDGRRWKCQIMKNARFSQLILLAIMTTAIAFAGCGLAYQAGTRIKAPTMSNSLQVDETSPEVHHSWGEPDLRTYLPGETEVWSYPYKPNSNDVAAAVMYTSSKDGDKGTFLDLKFVGGKLVSWQEAEHTMPAKGHTGIGLGINKGPIGNGTQTQPGAVHY